MSKKILFVLFSLCALLNFACGTTETNSNANAANSANTITNMDPKNMPPGLSGSPIPPSGNSTPGIPDSSNINAAKGTTPTPGIPADPGKPLPKGATPTPGIPDPETIKKQMNSNANPNVMNSTPPQAQSESGGDMRQRTIRKPPEN